MDEQGDEPEPARVIGPAGERWADEVLAARDRIATRPDLPGIDTERLTIRPYSPADVDELHAITDGSTVTRMGRTVEAYDADALVWRFMHVGPFEPGSDGAGQLAAYLDGIAARPDSQVLVVADRATDELVGSLALLARSPADLRGEIGSVFFTPAVQGFGVNREANQAVITALLDAGYQRIEWKCNALNLRSRRAAEAMGFTYEGTFRAHMVVKGRRRDTAWYALVPSDGEQPPA